MKRFLILVLICFSFNSFSQILTGGPWGMKFGMSRDSALKISRANLKANPTINTSDAIIYKNVKFDGHFASDITIAFYKDQFMYFECTFPGAKNDTYLFTYQDIKEKINSKYFKTNNERSSKYYTGATWNFPIQSAKDKTKEQGLINIFIDEKTVYLSYSDSKKQDQKIKEIKSKASSIY